MLGLRGEVGVAAGREMEMGKELARVREELVRVNVVAENSLNCLEAFK